MHLKVDMGLGNTCCHDCRIKISASQAWMVVHCRAWGTCIGVYTGGVFHTGRQGLCATGGKGLHFSAFGRTGKSSLETREHGRSKIRHGWAGP
jgi:hypothetical protein